MYKTIAIMLVCVVVAILIVCGCTDKRKDEAVTSALDEQIVERVDEYERHGLKCNKNAVGQLECVEIGKGREFILGTRKFDDIIIVDRHYLSKTGKEFGKDSVLYYLLPEGDDNCESEGFILFEDRKIDKRGLFNRDGDVCVPSEYDELKKVQNGMLIARKDATRLKYFDTTGGVTTNISKDCLAGKNCYEDCMNDGEYCYWDGGTWLLIDTLNNVLIENIGSEIYLDLYSIKKTEKPQHDTIRLSFPAKGGGYYSIISYKKEFMHWLTHNLLNGLTVEKLVSATYDTLEWKSKYSYGISYDRHSFVTENFKFLKRLLSDVLNPKLKIDVSIPVYASDIDPVESEKYFDNCHALKYGIYPAMKIDINYDGYKGYDRNNVVFLRTDDGYKLISVKTNTDYKFMTTE